MENTQHSDNKKMENIKQQKIEALIRELIKELEGEPFWRFEWLIHMLKKSIVENSTINTNLENIWENYSVKDFIDFSK